MDEWTGTMTPTWTMYFIENVVSRRVFICHIDHQISVADRSQRSTKPKKKDTHRVVITLKKVAHSVDGLRIDCEATEEVDKILVAHT